MNDYHPEQVSPPGETLQEILEERGITPDEFADQIGISPDDLGGILDGSGPITLEMAGRLEAALDVPAHFWENRERHYREYLAQRNVA